MYGRSFATISASATDFGVAVGVDEVDEGRLNITVVNDDSDVCDGISGSSSREMVCPVDTAAAAAASASRALLR